MKVIIIIPSYNRYFKLINLLNNLLNQNTKYNFKILVNDDNSTDINYLNLHQDYKNHENKLIFIRNNENKGKYKYWETINSCFNQIKEEDFDFLIQLDDDFEICENFIDYVLDFFKDIILSNNKISAMSLHLNNCEDGIKSRWGVNNSWVDGGTIYTREIIDLLNFKIEEISIKRWSKDKNLSSGVWSQISKRINSLGFVICKPTYSFLNHVDDLESKMNFENNRQINSYNFIDNKKPEDLFIYDINFKKNKELKNKDWWIKKRTL
jgi:hypothetical protein